MNENVENNEKTKTCAPADVSEEVARRVNLVNPNNHFNAVAVLAGPLSKRLGYAEESTDNLLHVLLDLHEVRCKTIAAKEEE